MPTPLITDGQREARCAQLTGIEIRADGDALTVSGYAAVFDSPSEDLGGWREVIKRGAFRKVLAADPDVRLMVNHEGVALARTTNGTLRLREDTKGLRIEADLADTSVSRDLAALLERGDIDQMSFRFCVGPEGREWFFPEESDELPTRIIREFSELFEVSAVTFPAYPATEIGVRAVICGEPIADQAGRLDREMFESVCERVHCGELDASEAERRALVDAAEQLQTVTPWQRERALRAADDEPQSEGAAADASGEHTRDDEGQGEDYGLAARQRRLEAIERDFAFANPDERKS